MILVGGVTYTFGGSPCDFFGFGLFVSCLGFEQGQFKLAFSRDEAPKRLYFLSEFGESGVLGLCAVDRLS